ncbi:phosphatase PAP2 family protein [Cellulomonas sp. NPDC055163]
MTSRRTDTRDAEAPHHPGRTHRLLRAAGFAAALGLPVAALAFVVRSQSSPVVVLDEAVIAAATDLTRDNPSLRSVLLAWQEAFRGVWVNPLVALLCLWAWRRHGLRTRATWAVVTLFVAWGLAQVMKQVVARARPVVEDAVAHADGFSFPSGHATNTAVAGLTVTLLVWPLLGPRGRVAVPAVAATLVVLTAADRVLLGVHYPSDVVAGVLVGTAMVGASYLGYVGRTPHLPQHSAPDTPATPDDRQAHP